MRKYKTMPVDLLQYAEGGALLLFAATIIYIIKLFLTRMKERDDAFNEMFTNHLNHNTEALHKVQEGLKEICGYMRSKNGNG